jgi:hypothetical protein
MSGRWFRMYASIRHDPKVQRLPLRARWALLMMWTLAAENDGVIPEEHLDYELGLKPYQCAEVVNLLLGMRLLERESGEVGAESGQRLGRLVPHNWRGRQYTSDNSTPRTRAYKERERSRAVPGTPPDTDTDTDTDTEKRREETAIAVAASERPNPWGWSGTIIRLNQSDYDRWKASFSFLDLDAELEARDIWLAEQEVSARRKWFQSTSKYLANRNSEARGRSYGPPPKRSTMMEANERLLHEYREKDRIAAAENVTCLEDRRAKA